MLTNDIIVEHWKQKALTKHIVLSYETKCWNLKLLEQFTMMVCSSRNLIII
jgi:hypothetical protein